jgi:hypothetical protein
MKQAPIWSYAAPNPPQRQQLIWIRFLILPRLIPRGGRPSLWPSQQCLPHGHLQQAMQSCSVSNGGGISYNFIVPFAWRVGSSELIPQCASRCFYRTTFATTSAPPLLVLKRKLHATQCDHGCKRSLFPWHRLAGSSEQCNTAKAGFTFVYSMHVKGGAISEPVRSVNISETHNMYICEH